MFTFHSSHSSIAISFDIYLLQVSQTFGETPRMTGPAVAEIAKELEKMCPLDKLAERRAWRDDCLTQLSVLKKKL